MLSLEVVLCVVNIINKFRFELNVKQVWFYLMFRDIGRCEEGSNLLIVQFLRTYRQPCFRGVTRGANRRAENRDHNEASVAPSQATLAAHPSAQNRPFRPPHLRPQSGHQRIYSARRHGFPQLSCPDCQREGGKSQPHFIRSTSFTQHC